MRPDRWCTDTDFKTTISLLPTTNSIGGFLLSRNCIYYRTWPHFIQHQASPEMCTYQSYTKSGQFHFLLYTKSGQVYFQYENGHTLSPSLGVVAYFTIVCFYIYALLQPKTCMSVRTLLPLTQYTKHVSPLPQTLVLW